MPIAMREAERERKAEGAHRKRARGARVVERLADGDDHRHQHPDSRDGEHDRRRARNDAGNAKNAGRSREPDGPEQLPEIRLRARCGENASPDLERQQRPDPPHRERKQTDARREM